MLRGEGILCGTSTTGTGTLTPAAAPSPLNGVDPNTWLLALGFVAGNVVPISYVLTEYVNPIASNLGSIVQEEEGVGLWTVASSLTGASLARTTVQETQTTVSGTRAYNVSAPTAISIGTAANTVISISAKAADLLALHPYYNTTGSDANWGVSPEGSCQETGASRSFSTTNYDFYQPFRWSIPMLVKRCSWRVSAYSSPTGSPTVSARIYAWNASGKPGKLLYDFTPSGGVAITATGAYSSGASGSGFLLLPGDYIIDFALVGLTGGAVTMTGGSPTYYSANPASFRLGNVSGAIATEAFASGAVAGAAPDPANITSFGLSTLSPFDIIFGLSPS